jgi:hypothetical protein
MSGGRPFLESKWEAFMDFVERIFGFSPDGGSGSFELMLLLVPVIAIFAIVLYRRSKRSRF